MTDLAPHPAKFGPDILDVLARFAQGRVLDPFAGIGRVHRLVALTDEVTETVGVEIEPEWAGQHPRTIVGNALRLPFRTNTFHTIATSPCYGNRLADHHDARDGSVRHSYTHDLGHTLHPDNAGALHFGEAYRRFHVDAWREIARVLRVPGRLILNVSDFVRDGQTIPVTTFHRVTLGRLGFAPLHEVYVPKRGMRFGANASARVTHEMVLVFTNSTHKAPARRGRRQQQAPRPQPPQLAGQLTIYDALGEP